MTEQSIQQMLRETAGFSQRQKLLKQLWKLRSASEHQAPVPACHVEPSGRKTRETSKDGAPTVV